MLNARQKEFIKAIEAASVRYRASDVFIDVCHCMACAIWRPFALDGDKVEKDFAATRERYSDEEFAHFVTAFAILQTALQERRQEFLGECMTNLEATNKANGQFLTPTNISSMIGSILLANPQDEVIKLYDPCCGAGVLLIEGAEAALRSGHKQHNLCIVAGDIDGRACDICYVQLALLGYAGVVRHMDALTQEQFGVARYTPGWFLHGFPMRRISA